jgi:redox-sensitive bicupin YhaK (pirin superfamily)
MAKTNSGPTSPIAALLKPHTKDLGGFEVQRLLPSIEAQMVGPFIFFDHFGPASFLPGQGVDVRPHPHIGLATVTYLLEGGMMHRDSLGSVQRIEPGDVNWMTAGAGIVHSERTSPEDRASGHRLHGLQTWVALPKAHEHSEPSFAHYASASLPKIVLPGVTMRLIAGTAFGQRSPASTFSPMFYVSVATVEDRADRSALARGHGAPRRQQAGRRALDLVELCRQLEGADSLRKRALARAKVCARAGRNGVHSLTGKAPR